MNIDVGASSGSCRTPQHEGGTQQPRPIRHIIKKGDNMNCPIHPELNLKNKKGEEIWGYCKKCNQWYQTKDYTW